MSTEIARNCECFGKNCMIHATSDNGAPLMFLVERDGKQIKVCSRCDLSSDKIIGLLITEDMDSGPFLDYDPLRWIVALGKLREKREHANE